MKLRIRSNSIRIRLDEDEIASLREERHLSEILRFGMEENACLTFDLELQNSLDGVAVRIDGRRVRIALGVEAAEPLLSGREDGIGAQHNVGEDLIFRLTIEKDYRP